MESKQDYTKLDNRGWVSRTFSPLTPGCIRGSIFTLLSSIIGAGILGIPFAEK